MGFLKFAVEIKELARKRSEKRNKDVILHYISPPIYSLFFPKFSPILKQQKTLRNYCKLMPLSYLCTNNIFFCYYFTWLVFEIYCRRVIRKFSLIILFGSAKETVLLFISQPSVHIYMKNFLWCMTFLYNNLSPKLSLLILLLVVCFIYFF